MEEVFCLADRALRFSDQESFQQFQRELRQRGLITRRIYRRFLYDGNAVSRLELAFSLRKLRGAARPLRGADLITILESIGKIRVQIPSVRSQSGVCTISRLRGHLSNYYLQSTTTLKGGAPLRRQDNWVLPGLPLALIEYSQQDLATLPARTIPVQSPASDLRLHYFRNLDYRGWESRGIWFIGTQTLYGSETLRRFRINLLRLHAEREVLKAVLRSIAREELPIIPRSAGTDRLSLYLRDQMRILSKQSRPGFPQTEVLLAARRSDEFVSAGERQTLLMQLQGIRGNILRMVRDFTAREAADQAPAPTTEVVVNHYEINFGDHATVHRDFVVAGAIQESFNTIEASDAKGELRAELKHLAMQIAEMTKDLPEEKAREVARNLETLTDEATGKSPKKWYDVSAQGIIGAAQAIGGAALPVIETVQKILSLLR